MEKVQINICHLHKYLIQQQEKNINCKDQISYNRFSEYENNYIT